MVDAEKLTAWWADEREREFTKLECGLLGATLSSIAILFLFTVKALIG